MRRRAPRPVSDALAAVTTGMAPSTPLAEVQAAWAESAGPAFAAVALPVSERAGVVTVACESAVWAQELDLMSEQVRTAINARVGRDLVKRLRVTARPLPG